MLTVVEHQQPVCRAELHQGCYRCPAQTPTLTAITQAEAVRLFAERAVAIKPEFVVTAKNAAAVAAVVRRLDGSAGDRARGGAGGCDDPVRAGPPAPAPPRLQSVAELAMARPINELTCNGQIARYARTPCRSAGNRLCRSAHG